MNDFGYPTEEGTTFFVVKSIVYCVAYDMFSGGPGTIDFPSSTSFRSIAFYFFPTLSKLFFFTDFTEPPENSAKAKLPLKNEHLNGNGMFVVNLPENTSSMSSTANLTHSRSCKLSIAINVTHYSGMIYDFHLSF